MAPPAPIRGRPLAKEPPDPPMPPLSTPFLSRRQAVLGALLLPPALAGCGSGSAVAQRGLLPDFADLAERVLPAVVNIAVSGEQNVTPPPEFRGTPFERYFRGRRERVQGAGSGFVIDPSGLVVTNNHVVGQAQRVTVGVQGGQELTARVIGGDELTDLALLRVESRTPLVAVGFGSSASMRIGQWVLAAGNPFGLGGTVTSGIISARGRDIGAGPFDDFIQTDAAINPGNSGGPLFNMAGEVIGINTAIYSPSGASAGIGFATPSDLARPVIETLRRDGRVERGWLGVSVQDLVAEDPRASRRAVLIAGVERTGPAGRGGLRVGDVVLAINGERTETSRGLIRSVAAVPPGQNVRLTVLRDGRTQDVTLQVGRRPPGPG
jgi:serine protease Do